MHSPIAPSSAPRWVVCPGSVAMESGFPDVETEEAKEGTEAHEIAAGLIAQASHGDYEPCDDEHVNLYVDDVISEMRKRGVFTPDVEQPVRMPLIHPQSFGTPDCALRDQNELIIWDFKYGHKVVEAFENWQLINYAAAFWKDGVEDQFITVRLRIVQPRAYHRDGPIREWVVTMADLRPYWNRLNAAAHEAMQPGARVVSGPHCYKCKALHACPMGQKAAMSAIDYIGSVALDTITPDKLGGELKLLRRAQEAIEHRLIAIESQVESNISDVVGWAIEQGYGRRKWTKSDEDIYNLGALLGIDLRAEKPVTPAEAKRRGLDESVIRAYSETPRTKPKLIKTDQSLAAKAFKNETR